MFKDQFLTPSRINAGSIIGILAMTVEPRKSEGYEMPSPMDETDE